MSELPIKIEILIPTHNSVELLDDTLNSIWAQDYNRESIFINIIDFASNDGTYEKLLEYDSYHFGIYRYEGSYTTRTMPSIMAKVMEYFDQRGEMLYQLLLWPGDIIYPDFFKKMTVAKIAECNSLPSLVVCETDVKVDAGEIVRPRSLFNTKRIIKGETELSEYVTIGYKQNIVCLGGEILKQKSRIHTLKNERIWWSNLLPAGMERNIVYIPEHLACIRERYYDDELEQILLRWELSIISLRSFDAKHEKSLGLTLASKAENSISKYAIWRSFLLWKKQDEKQAKECFEIASVINPEIKNEDVYVCLKELLNKNNRYLTQIEEFFND